MELFLLSLLNLLSFTMSDKAMDPYITCWENNRFSYRGYHDPTYEADERYIAAGGEGDVCDHTDPIYNGVRDTCYFQVMPGIEVWTYKCMHHNSCPLKDPITGEGIMGCKNVTNKRITCCCNDGDKCNGERWVKYANLGYAQNWSPTPQEGNTKGDTDTNIEAPIESTKATTTSLPPIDDNPHYARDSTQTPETTTAAGSSTESETTANTEEEATTTTETGTTATGTTATGTTATGTTATGTTATGETTKSDGALPMPGYPTMPCGGMIVFPCPPGFECSVEVLTMAEMMEAVQEGQTLQSGFCFAASY